VRTNNKLADDAIRVNGVAAADVINRLNVLRGKGMVSMYSWSCKRYCRCTSQSNSNLYFLCFCLLIPPVVICICIARSYKNGFVWHDLSDDDLVLPAQGNEYIIKGSELLDRSPPPGISTTD
jgi:hypothetical protein